MAAPARSLPRVVPAAIWSAGAITTAVLTLAAAAFPLRAGLAGLCAAAAAAWAWRNGPRSGLRLWAAAVPVAAWVVGVGGWAGAAAVAGAGLLGLVRTKRVGPALPAVSRRRAGTNRRESHPAGTAGASRSDPDQSFTRITTAARDAAAGALRVACAGGGGEGHVLFWPPFAGVPAVTCFPEDGVGRVKAACVLPHGVRFEVVRPPDAGDAKVCFEAVLS